MDKARLYGDTPTTPKGREGRSDRKISGFNTILTTAREDKMLQPRIGYDEALKIRHTYTSGGNSTEFTPIKHNINHLHTKKRHLYHCEVSTLNYGSSLFKLVSVNKKIIRYDSKDNIIEKVETKRSELDKRMLESISVTRSEDFQACDEKATNSDAIVTPLQKVLPTNFDEIWTPRSDTKRNLVSVRSEKDGLKEEIKQSEITNESAFRMIHQERSISQTSRVSHEQHITKMYRRILTQKHYPRSITLVILFFYGVIIATLLSQAAIKIVSDNAINNLAVMKDLLNASHKRSYYAISLQIIGRGGWLQISILISLNQIGIPDSSAKGLVDAGMRLMPNITEANHLVTQKMDSIDKDLRQQLFADNIQIKGSYEENHNQYEYINTFQASNKYINALKYLYNLQNVVSLHGFNAFEFLATNVLDDFLYYNEYMNTLFLKSVNTQERYLQKIIQLCFILTPLSLAVIGTILTLIIRFQYIKEKQGMLEFLNLPPKYIKVILKNLTTFRCLVGEGKFSYQRHTDMVTKDMIRSEVNDGSNFTKKKRYSNVKYSTTRNKYYGYVIKVAIYIILPFALMFWNLTSVHQSVKVIYKRQDQMQKANYIKTRISIYYATCVELFLSNNTLPILHKQPLLLFEEALVDVIHLQSSITKVFADEDGSYDPEIKDLLFDIDDCDRFTDYNAVYCSALASKGQPINMMSLMGFIENCIVQMITNFHNADRSTIASLTATYVPDVYDYLFAYGTVTCEAEMLVYRIDDLLGKSIIDAHKHQTLFLVVFLLSLMIVSVLIWYQILSKIREGHNDFNKVLQALPLDLVLLNPILKTYLMKHSRGL